jgi:hypothetical protein
MAGRTAARRTLVQEVTASPPPTSPPSGYIAWYDASQITGIADGALLNTWPDLSGNHYDLTPLLTGDPTWCPTFYKTTAGVLENGRPVVWFNGSASGLHTTGITLPQPFTVVAVARSGSTSPNDALIFSNGNSIGAYIIGDFHWKVAAGVGPMDTLLVSTAGLHFIAVTFNATTSTIQQDGTVTSFSLGSGGTLPLTGNTIFGSQWGGGPPAWLGPMCEMFIYPGALSTTQLATLRSYAQAKWATP